ncbi:hypothetical protein [Pandoravirus japonicus]|uniref:Transmembrane protein n=1 Tax=Pandoravirus japonicus TaxID=2823154 RepID=A0A811BMQ5_9VIRU|nr:hypothetical protein [Pandoravirus japonicus]
MSFFYFLFPFFRRAPSCVFCVGRLVYLLDQEKTASRPQCLIGRGGVGPQCGRGQRAKKTGACALFREREAPPWRHPPFGFLFLCLVLFFYTILFFSHVAALPFLFFISRRRREQQMMQWEWRSLACAFSLASSRVGHEDRTRMLFVFF